MVFGNWKRSGQARAACHARKRAGPRRESGGLQDGGGRETRRDLPELALERVLWRRAVLSFFDHRKRSRDYRSARRSREQEAASRCFPGGGTLAGQGVAAMPAAVF